MAPSYAKLFLAKFETDALSRAPALPASHVVALHR